MIVIAESNFVIELAFKQEEAPDADRVVTLAEEERIHLVVPACSLFEPFETLIRRSKERVATLARLKSEISQLGRSDVYRDLANVSKAVTQALAESATVEAASLATTIGRILKVAEVLPLTGDVVGDGLAFQLVFPLEPQDSMVFATADQFLKQQELTEQKLFINKNTKDFLTPEIEDHFKTYNCKVMARFGHALRFIEHSLAGPSSA